jgi:RNA polymerase sigma-70 factor (ECF subfamily)
MTPLLAQRSRVDRTFERLYRRHVGDVYRYALAVMRNPADAEDVTQTAFLNAYRAFQNGESPERPHNWLIAIAHNVCRQRFRQSARRPKEVGFDDDIGAELVENDPDAPSAEDIRRALGHLAFNQRAALVMRELEGRAYAEIAEILGLSASAVETLIFRARRALREQLEGSLTCGEAELAISRQLDGCLTRQEKGALRAHLRECGECASFARRQRAQRAALRSLGLVPVPSSLLSLFGGGGAGALGTTLAVKAAAAVAVGAVVGGVSYEGISHVTHDQPAPRAAATRAAEATSTTHVARPSAASADLAHLSRVRGRGAALASLHAPTAAHHGRRHARHTSASAAAHSHALAHRGLAKAHSVRPVRRAHPTHPAAAAHPTHPQAMVVHRAHPVRPVAAPVSVRPHPASHADPKRQPAQAGAQSHGKSK